MLSSKLQHVVMCSICTSARVAAVAEHSSVKPKQQQCAPDLHHSLCCIMHPCVPTSQHSNGSLCCVVQGGIYTLKLQFSERYPEKPPRVRFQCEMFHPNIYSDGNICLDIIQDKWSPCHNVCTILMSIQSLLTDPNCASPANPEAAQMYTKDKSAYNK